MAVVVSATAPGLWRTMCVICQWIFRFILFTPCWYIALNVHALWRLENQWTSERFLAQQQSRQRVLQLTPTSGLFKAWHFSLWVWRVYRFCDSFTNWIKHTIFQIILPNNIATVNWQWVIAATIKPHYIGCVVM